MEKRELETIIGTVEYITYYSEDSGYTVLELSTNNEEITVVGVLPYVSVGEQLALQGYFTVHQTFGPQFKALECQRSLPVTSTAILRYLSSGAIKGIGAATAQSIVQEFGDKTLEIIEKEPERLAIIKGISKNKALKISDAFLKQFGIREVMLKLSEFDLSPDEALRIYKKYGNSSVDRIKENPFLICCDEIGISFERADAICAELADEIPLIYRVSAGVEYVLRHNLKNGHTCLPRNKLVETASNLLEINYDDIDAMFDRMIGAGNIISLVLDEIEFIFLPHLYKAQKYCANRISLMTKVPPPEIPIHASRLKQFEDDNGILYDKTQKDAISLALSKGIMVLTGGPGTGKTTTLKAIISLLEETGLDIALAAPTGRAAKRMTELTGREAKTIHRLLQVEWGQGHKPIFAKNEKDLLKHDVIVIDELSMMDIQLFEALLRAISSSARLILVGDVDQLPSIGAGNVLHDLIDSEKVPVIRLTKVFRQAMESLIITNAHKILNGEMPEIQDTSKDFFLLNRQVPRDASRLIVDLCAKRLPQAYGFSIYDEIQVLCPSRKRTTGTITLNNLLQEAFNPPDGVKKQIERKGFILREGDKVMQIRNNYDVCWVSNEGKEGNGVFNGDIGIIKSIDKKNQTIIVQFEDKKVTYQSEEMEDLELSYATTVHKSQGSEFDCVVLSLIDLPPQLKYRNLLYTAVTRAKKLLVVVGGPDDVLAMVKNNRRTLRYTAFKKLLSAYGD